MEASMMKGKNEYLGIVEVERFKVLLPESETGSYRRLTTLSMQNGQPPELNEINLSEYEGQVVMVRGQGDNTWIWSAAVVEVAKPIDTALVKHLFQSFITLHPATTP
jgi:ABC-type taurine transport system substrate-binding protein